MTVVNTPSPKRRLSWNNFTISLSHLCHLGESQQRYISSERQLNGFHPRNDHLYRVSLDTRWHKVGTKFLQLLFVRKATTWKLEHWITLTNSLISHNWCWQSLVQNLWKGSHAKKFPTSYRCSLTTDQFHIEPKHGDIVDDVLTQNCRFSQFYKIFPWPFWSLKFTTADWPIFRWKPGHSSKMRSTSKSSQRRPLVHHGEYEVSTPHQK